MKFVGCNVAGAWAIDPEPHLDERGRFFRAWCRREFATHGIDFEPVQANMGLSLRRGTARGLHYQVDPAPEAKLVRCTRGSLFDVVVDLRTSSPTFGQWFGTVLDPANARMLYVPAGCAHGCQALADDTEFHYMTSAVYSPEHARGARCDDPAFAIDWPLPLHELSAQDRNWPLQPHPAS